MIENKQGKEARQMSNIVSVPRPNASAFNMDHLSDEDLTAVRQDLRQALDGIADVMNRLEAEEARRRDIEAVRLSSVADHEETLRLVPRYAART